LPRRPVLHRHRRETTRVPARSIEGVDTPAGGRNLTQVFAVLIGVTDAMMKLPVLPLERPGGEVHHVEPRTGRVGDRETGLLGRSVRVYGAAVDDVLSPWGTRGTGSSGSSCRAAGSRCNRPQLCAEHRSAQQKGAASPTADCGISLRELGEAKRAGSLL
jgi:hypothetical protein